MFVFAAGGPWRTGALGAKHRAEKVAERLVAPAARLGTRTAVTAAGVAFGMIAIGGLGGALVPGGVDLAAIELAARFGIGQQLVGDRHALEDFLGLGIAGIEVGMMLLGQLAISPANVGLAGVWRNAQSFIRIVQPVHRLGGHRLAVCCQRKRDQRRSAEHKIDADNDSDRPQRRCGQSDQNNRGQDKIEHAIDQ